VWEEGARANLLPVAKKSVKQPPQEATHSCQHDALLVVLLDKKKYYTKMVLLLQLSYRVCRGPSLFQ